jgi:nitrogen fixation/metabolism regulation signal transduction histidine kinase
VQAQLELAVPKAELRRFLESALRATPIVAAAALLLAVALGGFVARRITRPVRELAQGAAAIARGELDVRLEHVRRRDELWDLVGSFNSMAAELERSKEQLVRTERIAAWREIARRLAHEIKNPLQPIQMSIETMRRTRDRGAEFTEIFDEATRMILAEVQRLKGIVQEFSDFARMPKPRLAPCDVGEVARAALALYAGGSVPLRAELPPVGAATVHADAAQLQQVLLNLLENARDSLARKGAGEIIVRVRAADDQVELEVEDQGIGLSDEVRDRLFTPYFTTKERGTGLGLAIISRIVEDHAGRIRADGAPGRGAVFTITLPSAPAGDRSLGKTS